MGGLNLGWGLGDDPTSLRRNHREFAEAVGYRVEDLYQVQQVHGSRVLNTTRWRGERGRSATWPEADALWSRRPGDALAVRVADCVPVLLVDPDSGAAAAVHAGWRGVSAGVVAKAIRCLGGGRGLWAAVGPHIGPCCFEVGEEVVAQVLAGCPVGAEQTVARRDWNGTKPHLDLGQAVRLQITGAGVDAGNIEVLGGCTCCEPDRFFSYRRDGSDAGRHLAVILPPGPGLR